MKKDLENFSNIEKLENWKIFEDGKEGETEIVL